MGGGKGGSDFDPQGKVRQRNPSFLRRLHERALPPHRLGHRCPLVRLFFVSYLYQNPLTSRSAAGDIGTGGREIGFLFGTYKKLRNEFTGMLTGKGLTWGGSFIRPEATGYGLIYFVEHVRRALDIYITH